MAAQGKIAAKIAGRIADGLIGGSTDDELMDNFDEGGGKGKPRFAKMDLCIAGSEEEGEEIAYKVWANTGVKGSLNAELATTELIEQASSMVKKEDVVKSVTCSLDPTKHLEQIQKFVDAGYDHIYIHQIGPKQEEFFNFYQKNILPEIQREPTFAGR
jgi:alkanesulfonate monooxygenase SsuD/methylene tetrahydromethanopterin reductase-like flavin-dependent oxidoreductase (luciferase family)